MWELWDKVRCPTLLLRGADSDLLPASTAQEMTRRGPGAELIEFDGIGHLPALMTQDQIEPIIEFFDDSLKEPHANRPRRSDDDRADDTEPSLGAVASLRGRQALTAMRLGRRRPARSGSGSSASC